MPSLSERQFSRRKLLTKWLPLATAGVAAFSLEEGLRKQNIIDSDANKQFPFHPSEESVERAVKSEEDAVNKAGYLVLQDHPVPAMLREQYIQAEEVLQENREYELARSRHPQAGKASREGYAGIGGLTATGIIKALLLSPNERS